MTRKLLRSPATALFAVACILLFGAGGPPRRPDLVLTHARVMTLDSSRRVFSVIAVRDGRILTLSDSVDRAWFPGPKVIDLNDAVVAPAFSDHHAHLFNVGMALLNQRDHGRLAIDLSAVRSLAEVDALVHARAAVLPKGAWILGTGWNQADWGTQALPTAETLSHAAPAW